MKEIWKRVMKRSVFAVEIILLLCVIVSCQRATIRIGGVFEPEHYRQALALKYTVNKINAKRESLPTIRLTYDLQEIPEHDSFRTSNMVCRQMREGVAAIFGPMGSLSASHVQSVCNALEIPHLETRWDHQDNNDIFSVNLHPHYLALSRAHIDFIRLYRWTSFTILYDSNDGLIRLLEILKTFTEVPTQFKIRKLDLVDGDYRSVLKEVQKNKEYRIILDCDYRTTLNVLKQALTIQMMSQYYHYHLVTLDTHLIDLEEFSHDQTNITAFRVIDPNNTLVIDVLKDWKMQQAASGESPLENERGFSTEAALLHDAVQIFAKSLNSLSIVQKISTSPLSCGAIKPWEYGASMFNSIKMTQTDGLTGRIVLDHQGRRTDFELDLVELAKLGMEKIGTWNPFSGIAITKTKAAITEETIKSFQNKTLRVTTILDDPFMMLKKSAGRTLIGNDRYEGYCADLIAAIAAKLNLTYAIHLVGDNTYGSVENGHWTGMVQELLDDKADLAVASLTISWIREQVIDFTQPFMNLGISILYKRPEPKSPDLFSFLSPLSWEVWAYMVVAYLVVSIAIFVLARFSPYEWTNPHPCNQDSDVLENQFSFRNSLWFTVGSLMQQGCDISPRANSTRMVSSIWWFFTLILISSYTANLAAFLTVERMTSPIENADDLANQNEIKYGTVSGGSTMSFFNGSKIATYEKMWNAMIAQTPSVFVNNTKEGIERVKKGGYAYLLESTMNEYITERHCDLMQVGGLLDGKDYGIGTPQGSKLRDIISNVILQLQGEQELRRLYNKWWKELGTGQCTKDDSKKDANALGIANVGGVFVLLLMGLGFSMVIGLLEFLYKAKRNKERDKQQSICSEVGRELCFAINCCSSSTRYIKKAHPAKELPEGRFADYNNGSTLPPYQENSNQYNTFSPSPSMGRPQSRETFA